MANSQTDGGLRRRDVFRFASISSLAILAEPYVFGASDFWDKKKPGDWTDQEKEELRTKSPWAKKVDASISGGGGGAAQGGGGGGRGGRGGGGGGGGIPDAASGGGGGGRGGGGGGGGAAGGGGAGGGSSQSASLAIVWESAKPVQDAHPLQFPAQLNNHYVVAVSGVPAQVINAAIRGGRGGRGGAAPEDGAAPAAPPDPAAILKSAATLTVKGKPVENADIVLTTNQGATLLFAFPKDPLALAEADKEVEFELKLGTLTAKTKFNFKDMMYSGELAL